MSADPSILRQPDPIAAESAVEYVHRHAKMSRLMFPPSPFESMLARFAGP